MSARRREDLSPEASGVAIDSGHAASLLLRALALKGELKDFLRDLVAAVEGGRP